MPFSVRLLIKFGMFLGFVSLLLLSCFNLEYLMLTSSLCRIELLCFVLWLSTMSVVLEVIFEAKHCVGVLRMWLILSTAKNYICMFQFFVHGTGY